MLNLNLHALILPSLFVFVALGSFSGVFGTDWKEKTSRDFVRVKLKVLFVCHVKSCANSLLNVSLDMAVIY